MNHPGRRLWVQQLALAALLGVLPCVAAPANPAPTTDREATELVRELLAQRPNKELSLDGVFKIRHSDGRRGEVPVRYAVHLLPDHWESVYQTTRIQSLGAERLVVTHRADQPSRYDFTQVSPDGLRTNSMTLTGSEANISFVGSDFWLSDLGMEFLHWPEQHLVRNAAITMRLGRPCKVLESINPQPSAGAYRRVVSWIDSELGNLIYAEAYDLQNKRFKVFSLKGFKKVNGHWQVKEMELRNDKADSRTRLEFNFETE